MTTTKVTRAPGGTPIVFSTDPTDPPFWPKGMTLEDKLARLKLLDPKTYTAAGVLIDYALRQRWPQPPRRRKADV
jgi:hypothetical protein